MLGSRCLQLHSQLTKDQYNDQSVWPRSHQMETDVHISHTLKLVHVRLLFIIRLANSGWNVFVCSYNIYIYIYMCVCVCVCLCTTPGSQSPLGLEHFHLIWGLTVMSNQSKRPTLLNNHKKVVWLISPQVSILRNPLLHNHLYFAFKDYPSWPSHAFPSNINLP